MGTGSGVSPSLRVVQQVAASKNVDPADLEPPLHEVLDPDALDSLIRSAGHTASGAETTIEFVYRDRRVRIDSSGTVDVTELEQRSDSSPNSADSHTD